MKALSVSGYYGLMTLKDGDLSIGRVTLLRGGTLVTAYHCVHRAGKIEVAGSGRMGEVTVVRKDLDLDLALLQWRGPSVPPHEPDLSVQLYPYARGLSGGPMFTPDGQCGGIVVRQAGYVTAEKVLYFIGQGLT